MPSKLTEKFLADLACPVGKKDVLVFDTITGGLGVRVTVGGAKVFVVQWTDPATKRKQRERLGEWGSISLEQARQAAKVALGKIAQGVDPKAERAAAKAADDAKRQAAAKAKEAAKFTLDKLITQWAEEHLAHRRDRYSTEAQRALRVAFAAHLDRPASALDHRAVTNVLGAFKTAGKLSIAGRTSAYGRAAYGWAVSHRKVASNPFADLPTIEGSAPKRDRVLSDWETGAIWRTSIAIGEPFGPIVRMLLLTGCRREEVTQARWSEISKDLTTWTIPGERSKNGKPHIVHLAEPARAILKAIARLEKRDLIFGTRDNAPSGFSRAKTNLDAALIEERRQAGQDNPEGQPGWRFHDFRRTVVTWLASNGFPPHVADRLLNHVSGTISGVAAVYQKAEFLVERKAALEAWAVHVLRCAECGELGGNVVPLRGVA